MPSNVPQVMQQYNLQTKWRSAKVLVLVEVEQSGIRERTTIYNYISELLYMKTDSATSSRTTLYQAGSARTL